LEQFDDVACGVLQQDLLSMVVAGLGPARRATVVFPG
jgi:hypothetical protein